jgi:hypothetical protein
MNAENGDDTGFGGVLSTLTRFLASALDVRCRPIAR